jgi:diketogulonate reductase-like aldo/keto reductase
MMTDELNITSCVTLNNGVEMPWFGLGVFQTPPGPVTEQAVAWALEAGYRHVDTARVYKNEEDVGKALRAGGLPRQEIFITTKLWNADHGYEQAKRAARRSLERLGLDYFDLYLIHWPVERLRRDSWKALEELHLEGLCRAIGVSNYTIRHLEELFTYAEVLPAVNQVEFSPFLHQKELLAFCRTHDILLEGYSPLTKGERLNHPVLAAIAAECGRSPAQVLIRWCLQHETVVIPKSQQRKHILANAQVFDFRLSGEQMAQLDTLDEGLRTSWDPTDQP